jgi:hypothetical protein
MEERTTDVRAAERRLERARAQLKQAMSRLAAVRRAALYGEHDPEALDDAVLTCREAQDRVREARLELEREWSSALGQAAPAPAPALATPEEPQEKEKLLEITPRLLFARWLVQTGRLSDEVMPAEVARAALAA